MAQLPDNIHVLLVDDEQLSRFVVGNLLRKCNYAGGWCGPVSSRGCGSHAASMCSSPLLQPVCFQTTVHVSGAVCMLQRCLQTPTRQLEPHTQRVLLTPAHWPLPPQQLPHNSSCHAVTFDLC